MEIRGYEGNPIGATEDGRMRTYAGQESEIAFQSRVNGNAYIWSASQDLGADKCALYLRNDDTIPLVIEKISFYGSAAATYELWMGSNTITVAGTPVVGKNLNTASSNIAKATCTHTETGADTGGSLTLIKTVQSGATTKETLSFNGSLVLGYLGELALIVVTDIALTSVAFMGYYQPVA
jgi:hypothetical protein